MKPKPIVSLPFRILASAVMLFLITSWLILIYKFVMTDKYDGDPAYIKSFIVTGVPLLFFWIGLPTIFGDYPKWSKKFVPAYLQYIFRSEVKKMLSDLPWRRNPEVVKDLEKIQEKRDK